MVFTDEIFKTPSSGKTTKSVVMNIATRSSQGKCKKVRNRGRIPLGLFSFRFRNNRIHEISVQISDSENGILMAEVT